MSSIYTYDKLKDHVKGHNEWCDNQVLSILKVEIEIKSKRNVFITDYSCRSGPEQISSFRDISGETVFYAPSQTTNFNGKSALNSNFTARIALYKE